MHCGARKVELHKGGQYICYKEVCVHPCPPSALTGGRGQGTLIFNIFQFLHAVQNMAQHYSSLVIVRSA